VHAEDKHPLTLLERTMMAEYLFSKGYLMSEMLDELPLMAASRLMKEARRFASLRLVEIGSRTKFLQEIRLNISLN
jgi:hypothetical protein